MYTIIYDLKKRFQCFLKWLEERKHQHRIDLNCASLTNCVGGRINLANVDVFVKVVTLDVVVVVIQCNKNLKSYQVKVFTLKIQLKIWSGHNLTIYASPSRPVPGVCIQFVLNRGGTLISWVISGVCNNS